MWPQVEKLFGARMGRAELVRSRFRSSRSRILSSRRAPHRKARFAAALGDRAIRPASVTISGFANKPRPTCAVASSQIGAQSRLEERARLSIRRAVSPVHKLSGRVGVCNFLADLGETHPDLIRRQSATRIQSTDPLGPPPPSSSHGPKVELLGRLAESL